MKVKNKVINIFFPSTNNKKALLLCKQEIAKILPSAERMKNNFLPNYRISR